MEIKTKQIPLPQTHYSNCLIEAIKAKMKNNNVKIMYIPAFLNEVYCPHFMWVDDSGEHSFWTSEKLKWWQILWHKGEIRTRHRGCYKACIGRMIERKYYEEDK